MTSQKEAVFQAIKDVMGERGTLMTSSERKQVVDVVVAGFQEGLIELSVESKSKFNTVDKLKAYTGGLVSNWLRKDPRLNGGEKHITKNPGSRNATKDDSVKALRALRGALTDAVQIAAVDAEISNRLEALKVVQVTKKAKAIDINFLPEEFRHLINA